MAEIVERYIYEKKGVQVTIMLELFFHPLFVKRQLQLLNEAYNVAIHYFKTKDNAGSNI